MIGSRVLPHIRIRVKANKSFASSSFRGYSLQLRSQLIQSRFATTRQSPTSSIVQPFEGSHITNRSKLTQEDKKALSKFIANPLEKIQEKIKSKSFVYPYNYLNEETEQQLDLFESFVSSVNEQIMKIDDFDDSYLTFTEFINPNSSLLPVLINSIQNGKYPKEMLEICNLQDKNELLEHILTHVLYKDYLEYKIETTPYEKSMIDFSNPAQWFPEARKMKRKIIMHVGPTNSGKTYHSLQKLSKVKTGYYAGPLRLLAREIYERFNNQGIGCNLITGEEVIPSIDEYGRVSGLASGTIEMIPLHKKMDLCVIDEIQMIGDAQRGSVWTNAVLGVLAHEIHLCGEESAVPLIEKLVKITGDELVVKKFDRLGKLTMEKKPTSLKTLKKGDCLVVFSKRKILEYKCSIEQETKLKVGMIYGALPPEIRAQEAVRFNSGEYDVLVASDAIGMGLNLKINRIVFSGINKFNGSEVENLTTSQVKQIAGRAGRFSAEHGSKEGLVTALQRSSLLYIKECLETPIVELEKACLWPTGLVWKYYMTNYSTESPLSETLSHFINSTLNFKSELYFLADLEVKTGILEIISKDKLLKNMTIDDQLTLSETPVSIHGPMNRELVIPTVKKFFKNIVERDCKTIFDFGFLDLHLLSAKPLLNKNIKISLGNVEKLESMHKLTLLFLWLSQRFPTLFIDKKSAMELKALVEKRITEELNNIRRMNKMGRR
ncbi:Suv3 protein [Candida orthopsilosis Co 90-125]|uniref:ATP-dependent RNA helicase SUV3, mitochondrial n=1 Tax=Candida orthopsilosis (strain 90-125) TaxID=1136231 RepID=H8WYW0_CANO9|nr:Suv3 protein [Candida orthopsilosis Co 90-125]CCG21592.1 Suv3 protein [Candida orthopsilosis Co 90-125]